MNQKLTDKSLHALEYDKMLEMLGQQCSCPDSAELAAALRPYSDIEEARQKLSETEDACRLSVRFGGPSFFGMKNIASALSRAKHGSSLTMKELLDVASVLSAIQSLSRYRETSKSVSTCLDSLFDSLSPNRFLEETIYSSILSEDEIADTASPALADIRRKIKRAGVRVREQLDKMIHSSTYQKYLQDPIVTIRDGRFVVPVKCEYKSDVPGLVHDTSASGATLFIEPMPVVESNNELRVLMLSEEKEIERILQELSEKVGGFADNISESYKTAIALDFIFARARLSFKMRAAAPVLCESGETSLVKARHPLIDPKKVVPVDIMVGGGFDTLVVTGPNTGGKTVVLKTLGLLVLMALSGLMIPASDESRICFFGSVLADIGDEQSIEQSLSTFSAHMTNIIDILNESGSSSLILLDELGSGTDPVEGAALAISILEYLKNQGAKIAATTHYAELKVYALQTEGVENACCEFDVATLRPTYRLLIGVPGRSNAFAISERLGLKLDIIDRAKGLVSNENLRFEDVVQNLETSRQQMEAEKSRAAVLRAEAERFRNEAEQQKAELEKEKDREIEKARVQAKRLLEQSRMEARKLLDEIEDIRKKKDSQDLLSLKDAAKAELNARLKSLEEKADPVSKRKKSAYRLPRQLKAGDTVILTDIDKRGTVLSAPDASGFIEIQAGIIKTRVHQSGLRLVEEKHAEPMKKYAAKTNIDRARMPVKSELDLRGFTVEEALEEIDKFIDNAMLAGLGQICIIHGKGTGALRTAVQQHLKTNRSIKNYRLGRYGEGENGVTIAELQ